MLKYIYPDMNTVPEDAERVTIHAVVENPLADKWLAYLNTKKKPETILVKDVTEFGFDGGGMVHRDEPTLTLDVNGWTFSVMLRQAELLPGMCRRIQSHIEELGPHVYLRGYWVSGILTVESGEKIAEWIESQMPQIVAKSDQLWAEFREKVTKAGAHVPERVLK